MADVNSKWYFEILGWEAMYIPIARMYKKIETNSSLGKLVLDLALRGRDYAEEVTHKDTTALSHSHRVAFSSDGIDFKGKAEAHIYVSPIRNPKTGVMTTDYAGVEDARGGEHAFYQIVVEKGFPKWVNSAMEEFAQDVFR